MPVEGNNASGVAARRSAAFARLPILAGVIDELTAIDPDDLPIPELAGLLQQLDTQRNRLDAVALNLTANFHRRGGAQQLGDKDTAAFLRDKLRRRPSDAKQTATAAQALQGLEQTREALSRGDISAAHAAEIADAAAGLDDPDAETKLLATAKRGDPSAVRYEGKRLTDRQQAADQARRAYDGRRLDFRNDPAGGVRFEGYGPDLAAEILRTGIDALAAPSGEDDDRTPAQRRFDALVELTERATAAKALPDDGGERPVLLALLTVDALEQRAGAPPGILPRTGPLDPLALEQLLCEAELECVVTGPDGQPLYLGRSKRYANRAQRRALRARDGGCRWPGCDAPATWAIAHHEPPWDLDGVTDIDKLVLFCKVHHWMRHHGGWCVALDTDATVTVTSPDGATVRSETAAQARLRHLGADLLEAPRDGPDRRARPARPDPPRDDGADPPRPDTEPPTLPGIASEDRSHDRAA